MSQPYEVPELTRAEVRSVRDSNSRPADCPQCKSGTPVDHWPSPAGCNSSFRRDDNGTERLFRVHCTCDRCF
ncbi:hypothetical protein [Streptomyces sp. NBC_00120]|uniref:hypothetical protein n=1 Tax=Streptomyces sp. NBC_00120 TaxID=2975660 RepID=UPI00225B8771|nr:hypothetical protein [Streptomyces sp. NBC_00120]MCX5326349.1 hypothetical protein [Streptomyces sp. NBC_00120]